MAVIVIFSLTFSNSCIPIQPDKKGPDRNPGRINPISYEKPNGIYDINHRPVFSFLIIYKKRGAWIEIQPRLIQYPMKNHI